MNNFWGFTENPSFRGGLGKKQGSGVFEGWRGGVIPQCTLNIKIALHKFK